MMIVGRSYCDRAKRPCGSVQGVRLQGRKCEWRESMAKKSKKNKKTAPRSKAKSGGKKKSVKKAAPSKKSVGKSKPKAKSHVATKSRSKPPASVQAQIEALEKKLQSDKLKLVELRRKAKPQSIGDYTFTQQDGSHATLSSLFGSKKDLILVHNMGKGCAYCTLWADGFNGLTSHLENRAAFVVVSKDEADSQRRFRESRGWTFRMVSSLGSTFNRDMHMEDEKGHQMPGVSAFHKKADGIVYRTGSTYFGPGDDFCALWPMLDLLKDGTAGWGPKFAY